MIHFALDGVGVSVPDDGASLLEVLRERLGARSVKDGCSPQGQCGCCTVWIDGAPRVSCVTPARRVAGRQVTTLDGLDPHLRDLYAHSFSARGASQCGFCTPGIIMRLAGTTAKGENAAEEGIRRMLSAHLCRCTGWQSVVEAGMAAASTALGNTSGPDPSDMSSLPAGAGRLPAYQPELEALQARDLTAASARAEIEGGIAQSVGIEVALGRGGFASDSAPSGVMVALPPRSSELDDPGLWTLGDTPEQARRLAGKVQGRRSTAALRHPLEVPPGSWAITLATTFVEPAYLEPDASWCLPAGEPASPLANGGAFGGKTASPAPAAARLLADLRGAPVRVAFDREDVVRLGPKRPPMAAGLNLDGSGVVRVAITPGSSSLGPWIEAFSSVLPRATIEEVAVPGPPVSAAIRAAGWAEAAVLDAVLRHLARAGGHEGSSESETVAEVYGRAGGSARASLRPDGSVLVEVEAGELLDSVVLRSYCLGAAHQALGWVRSEGVAVSTDGSVLDLTIRSFGILPAARTPPIEVRMSPGSGPAVNGSDTVFAAVAAAAWIAAGLPPAWPSQVAG